MSLVCSCTSMVGVVCYCMVLLDWTFLMTSMKAFTPFVPHTFKQTLTTRISCASGRGLFLIIMKSTTSLFPTSVVVALVVFLAFYQFLPLKRSFHPTGKLTIFSRYRQNCDCWSYGFCLQQVSTACFSCTPFTSSDGNGVPSV